MGAVPMWPSFPMWYGLACSPAGMATVCSPNTDVRHEAEAELSAPRKEHQDPVCGRHPSGTAFFCVAQGDTLLDDCIADTLRWLMDSRSIIIPDASHAQMDQDCKNTKAKADKTCS